MSYFRLQNRHDSSYLSQQGKRQASSFDNVHETTTPMSSTTRKVQYEDEEIEKRIPVYKSEHRSLRGSADNLTDDNEGFIRVKHRY